MYLGGFTLKTFSVRSHGWGDDMNVNLLKLATLMHPSVVSRTQPLPPAADDNTARIDPETGLINVWLLGQWNTITPAEGAWVHVRDANTLDHFDAALGWRVGIDLNAAPGPTPRTLAFYAPEAIRPNTTVFAYACGQEFTLQAGAPGSSATLEVAPAQAITVSIRAPAEIGTITFAAGAVDGIFAVPAQTTLLPVQAESQYSHASRLTIASPADLHGARGLSITLRGVVRPPQEG